MFTGSVTCSQTYNGCFVGYIDSGSATVSNCLSTGSFDYTSSGIGFYGAHTNCYVKQFPTSIPSEMQCTDERLANGTIATALQNGRDEEIWVQDRALNQPMLKIFVSNNSGITTGFISIDNGKMKMENEANGWFSISGQKLNGKPATKGIYINNGRKVVVN